ncbi:phosphoenolpyruvate synthase [Streptomyces sp. NBC_00243]|uniref:phosphoenolpyruvate synthase n=1 Tax=Streptomyces sp. NBC_00243 TaxID=2975688 RepID=UPI002DDC4224|nr:phosphoenolpyruvate synthase [Streptomyces sp. NBC_00243]WRZ17344.1 phosphoenolpyruvate synthase [Streptomyces sp. NBC_00243]
MPEFIIPLSELGSDSIALAGGKGASLGVLNRAGMPVPDGFCVTTRAFARFIAGCEDLDKFYIRLDQLDPDDLAAIARVGVELRGQLGELPMPDDVRADVLDAWRGSGEGHFYAVRSSATAEDLADASFAGQQDTYLNIGGQDQLLDSVRRCWVSLFTDRAIGYRARLGFRHQEVELAVVVQRMVLPEAAGVMFTADPVSGHRHTIVVNAARGLGEAVVSGLVNPDLYRIEANGTVQKSIADKRLAVRPLPSGGVVEQDVPEAERRTQALSDQAIEELVALGRRIQDHFGAPQDIEWAFADGRIHVLQSRPITSLFPLPEPPGDRRLRVYFSFGHQQVMTDAIKPLGISVLRTFFPLGKRRPNGESTQQVVAGSRLFFDYTEPLHSPLSRRLLARAVGSMDKRVGEAVLQVAASEKFREHQRFNLSREFAINVFVARTVARIVADLCWVGMETKQSELDAFAKRTLAKSRAETEGGRGANAIARVQRDLQTVGLGIYFNLTLPQGAAMAARRLIVRLAEDWLGDVRDVAELDKSLPGNVATEMALAIGDLADLVRGRPALLAFLESPPEPFTMRSLDALPSGAAFRQALEGFIDRYGMRCPGEIDITRVRWSDKPEQLFAGIVANARTGRVGEHRARFLAAQRQTEEAIGVLLDRIRATRRGRPRAAVMARLINVYRTTMGLREHQKFLTVSLWDIYRRVIHQEAQALTTAGILDSPADADFVSLDELRRLVDGEVPADLAELLVARRTEYEGHRSLTPPRLFTSEGELVTRAHAAHHKKGVLVGAPVSAGVCEGRARVILRPQDARLEDGDILVARFTDPAWTPLFSTVRGIVLEVGGLMTHGAVVARELGIPSVVGIDDATRLIKDGTRIRVDGTLGTVEPIDQ